MQIFDMIFESEGPEETNPDFRIELVLPKKFDEAERAGIMLKDNRVLLVNISRLKGVERQRFLDFLSGVTMAKDGKIKRIDQHVVICVPRCIIMGGDIDL